MALAIVDSGTDDSAGVVNSFSFVYASTPTDGNLIVITQAVDGGSPPSTPSGFAELHALAGVGSFASGLFWKVADSEGSSISLSVDSGNVRQVAGYWEISGQHATPIDANDEQLYNSTAIPMLTMTATDSSSLLLTGVNSNNTPTTTLVGIDSTTFSATHFACRCAGGIEEGIASGATGTRAHTHGAQEDCYTWGIIIRPAAAGGGGSPFNKPFSGLFGGPL